MRKSYRRIYIREIIKACLLAISILALLVCILWGCMFVTDYIMFKNNKPTVFTDSLVEKTEDGKIIYEEGIFYHVVTDENEERTLYLFNKEINIK